MRRAIAFASMTLFAIGCGDGPATGDASGGRADRFRKQDLVGSYTATAIPPSNAPLDRLLSCDQNDLARLTLEANGTYDGTLKPCVIVAPPTTLGPGPRYIRGPINPHTRGTFKVSYNKRKNLTTLTLKGGLVLNGRVGYEVTWSDVGIYLDGNEMAFDGPLLAQDGERCKNGFYPSEPECDVGLICTEQRLPPGTFGIPERPSICQRPSVAAEGEACKNEFYPDLPECLAGLACQKIGLPAGTLGIPETPSVCAIAAVAQDGEQCKSGFYPSLPECASGLTCRVVQLPPGMFGIPERPSFCAR